MGGSTRDLILKSLVLGSCGFLVMLAYIYWYDAPPFYLWLLVPMLARMTVLAFLPAIITGVVACSCSSAWTIGRMAPVYLSLLTVTLLIVGYGRL